MLIKTQNASLRLLSIFGSHQYVAFFNQGWKSCQTYLLHLGRVQYQVSEFHAEWSQCHRWDLNRNPLVERQASGPIHHNSLWYFTLDWNVDEILPCPAIHIQRIQEIISQNLEQKIKAGMLLEYLKNPEVAGPASLIHF